MKIIQTSNLSLQKTASETSREEQDRIKRALTRIGRDLSGQKFENKYYLESPTRLYVPRFFPLHLYMKENIEIIDRRAIGEDIKISHNITPRNDIQIETIKYMINNDSGIIKLPPGSGKTVISIAAISEMKKKSIIFVHKRSLVDQWCDRLLEFTDLKKDDISKLSSSSFEANLEKSVILTTVQTYYSILKKNKKKFVSEIRKANIGVLVSDEAHTTSGAPAFSTCMFYSPARVIFGLSATPERYDGSSDVLEHHLGKITHPKGDSDTMIPTVLIIKFNHYVVPGRYKYIFWNGEFQRARYLSMLIKSNRYISVMKDSIERSYKADRNVLFLVERKKVISKLAEVLDIPKTDIGHFHGSADMSELNHKVVLATPNKARDGVDAPWLDTVIFGSPVANIEQAVGRVVRTLPEKNQPLVIDFVDTTCEMMKHRMYRRVDYYKKQGWEISIIDLDN